MGPSNAISGAQRYLATVPDTLDLAQRAALAINALTGAAECEKGFCETIRTSHLDHRPPYMNLRYNSTSASTTRRTGRPWSRRRSMLRW